MSETDKGPKKTMGQELIEENERLKAAQDVSEPTDAADYEGLNYGEVLDYLQYSLQQATVKFVQSGMRQEMDSEIEQIRDDYKEELDKLEEKEQADFIIDKMLPGTASNTIQLTDFLIESINDLTELTIDFMKNNPQKVKESLEGYEPPKDSTHFFDIIINTVRENLQQEEQEEKKEEPVHLQPVVPKYYTMLNSKFADSIGELINVEDAGISIGGRGKGKKEIITPVSVTMLSTDGVQIDGNYTEFDKQVQNAIVSLYLDGKTVITSELILRTMTHNKSGRLSPQMIGAVTKSIERQRIMHVDCDMTQVINQKGYEADAASLGRMLLVLDDATVEIGGVVQKGYQITQEPILLEYSKRVGNQIATVPAYLLDIHPVNDDKTELLGGSLSNSIERINIRGYLMHRIAIMRHDNEQAKDAYRKYKSRQKKAEKDGDPLPDKSVASFRKESNRILCSSVFEAAGVADKGKQTLANYKDYINTCLDNWTLDGWIPGYEKVSGRRKDSEIAVDILLE